MPTNRTLKSYCDLYFEMIPKPDLIIYNVDSDTSALQMREWLDILLVIDHNFRICFFSQARTYVERQQIFSKIGPLFYREITEHIYFPKID